MKVYIEWTTLNEDQHELWAVGFCLYAYLHPLRDWLLYVGKADYSTVRGRLHGAHKQVLFRDLWSQYRIDQVRVLHGALIRADGGRRTSELLADVESLLIKRLAPFGNIQSRNKRICRPGLRIECVGAWPFRRSRFHDDTY